MTKKYSLENIDNYKKTITNTSTEIYSKYLGLIQEYIVQYIESTFIKNNVYHKYIIYKGIETISHIFKIILLYTKNLELVYHHCKTSIDYYIIFIGQINTDDNNFLKLNSKDASIFVYNKTIFQINNEYKKKFEEIEEDEIISKNVNLLINIYNRSLYRIIQCYDMTQDIKHKIIKKIDMSISKLTQNLLNLILDCDEKLYLNKLQVIDEFDINLSIEEKKEDYLILYVEILTKKLKKNNMSIDKLHIKFLNNNNKYYFQNYTPLRYINWLFQI